MWFSERELKLQRPGLWVDEVWWVIISPQVSRTPNKGMTGSN